MKTKLALALAMIGLSSTVIAGAPGNNMVIPTGTPVIAPDSTGTWSFGLEALYMESNTNFQYASVSPGINDDGEREFDNESATNNWNWGGEADISYVFPGSSRDISASYTYLNQDNSDSVDSDPEHAIVAGVDGFPHNFTVHPTGLSTLTNVIDGASADVDQTLNAATLTFGQLLTVGSRISLHPFGGLQFASIDTSNRANYDGTLTLTTIVPPTLTLSDPTVVTPYETSYKNTSDFVGAGPRAGMDASVHLCHNFSIVGTVGAALLVGNMDSKFEFGVAETGIAIEDKNDSYTAVVPELDAKLGLDYMYAFNPNTSMNIQVGYEVVDYFNAETNNFIDSNAANSVNTTTDFNYNGPYLRLQLNVA
ncbi:MAG: hypothetical protein HKM04_06650 [Legionellales bacterium]|nr:hypothetical protein [Legionellales bacterium]